MGKRLAESSTADSEQPITQSANIHYGFSKRYGGTGDGMAAVHAFVKSISVDKNAYYKFISRGSDFVSLSGAAASAGKGVKAAYMIHKN